MKKRKKGGQGLTRDGGRGVNPKNGRTYVQTEGRDRVINLPTRGVHNILNIIIMGRGGIWSERMKGKERRGPTNRDTEHNAPSTLSSRILMNDASLAQHPRETTDIIHAHPELGLGSVVYTWKSFMARARKRERSVGGPRCLRCSAAARQGI